MNGTVGILNVGAGDTKLSFDPKNPAELERAKKIVLDMLRKGYAILVAVPQADGSEPLYRRARDFDPETCEYIIAGGPDDAIDLAPRQQTKQRGRPKGSKNRVKADKAHAVAVGRTAGG